MNRDIRLLTSRVIADHITPVSVYAALGGDPYSFLLESVEKGKNGRYSFIGFNPRRIYELHSGSARILKKNKEGDYIQEKEVKTSDPVEYLGGVQERYTLEKPPQMPPFCGGLVGYASYETLGSWEKISFPEPSPDDPPLGIFMFVDELVAFDHLFNTAQVIKAVVEGEAEAARRRLDEITRSLNNIPPLEGISLDITRQPDGGFISNFSRESFMEAVESVKEKIISGEIIQGVLSQRLEAPAPSKPLNCYRALRVINPSPYMFYFRFENLILCGSSPEVLVKLQKDRVMVKPIAGTRGRSADGEDDLRLEKELKADEKERAEHIMLVDLGRNDLARVSLPGTVKVDEFMAVERYSHVMHMVSEVSGKVAPGVSVSGVFRACFPAGTVSGAPKLKAVEIIRDLENTRRGPYAGAAGYFSFTGGMDTCIAIRTIIIRNDRAYVQAGAGIVKDSVPELEYEETMRKAGALLEAVRIASAGG